MENYQFTDLFKTKKEESPLRRTKIVCSVGPSCEKVEILVKMLQAGCNVFRLNCSFGDHELLKTYVERIRQASKESGIECSILGDLQGPKFRTGEFESETIQLEEGKEIQLVASKEKGNESKITTPNERLVSALKEGDRVLINDGIMELQVTKKDSDSQVTTKVIHGGELSKRKGLNVPGTDIVFDDLMEKDKKDALFLLDQQIDFIGQSFVQTKEDVDRLRKHLQDNVKEGQFIPQIIVKVEKPKALQNIDEILEATDGIMVARGDLGVELPFELVPVMQKMLIKKSNAANKPVILATQLLQSMMKETIPLRAEVSDVANGIFDGTDAVMTSGETTMSPHPALVVQTMNDIVLNTETHSAPNEVSLSKLVAISNREHFRHAIISAALEAAEKSTAKCIIVFSAMGTTALRMSKGKPGCPIIAITSKQSVAQWLRLCYGVYPIVLETGAQIEQTLAQVEKVTIEKGYAKAKDLVVICGGKSSPIAIRNALKIYQLGEFMEHTQSN